jgi:hypothetical protein
MATVEDELLLRLLLPVDYNALIYSLQGRDRQKAE